MDLKSIQAKLNEEFEGAAQTGAERRLVFWYDGQAEFQNEVEALAAGLPNARLYRLAPDNWFYTKYFLETVDTGTNYLVYAPFPKPADRDNHLADLVYYSREFVADKLSLVMRDLRIPERLREQVKKHARFFQYQKYTEPFAALGVEAGSEEELHVGILSVLCGVRTPSFDEVIRSLLVKNGFDGEGGLLAVFDRMDMLGAFWELCSRHYGYKDEKPDWERFVLSLFVTHAAHEFKGELPKPWSLFLLPKRNDASVFVSHFMNHLPVQERFAALSEAASGRLQARESLAACSIGQILECDTFAAFDERILDSLLERLADESQAVGVRVQGTLNVSRVAEVRLKRYFGRTFEHDYRSLACGWELLELADAATFSSGTILEDYVQSHERIDRLYRHFYVHYDKLAPSRQYLFAPLRQQVENMYANAYLPRQAVAWTDKLAAGGSVSALPYPKQSEFYRMHVEPAVKKGCTAVIISDAFRYECAVELHRRWKDQAKTTSELHYMMSSVPSYTELGMASLLPHRQISFTDRFEVRVDGQPCQTTAQRQQLLQRADPGPGAVAFTSRDILQLLNERTEARTLLKEKELIYIYHNQIDARGDHAPSEHEVFDACEEAMEEIMRLVAKLTVVKSITSYIITADHGFLYRRDKPDESEKINLPAKPGSDAASAVVVNKRFLLAAAGHAPEVDHSLTLPLDAAGPGDGSLVAVVPRGAAIFKVSGGGQNYIHGGASLQEMVVPVIKVKTERYRKETGHAELVLVSLTRKITNLVTYLDFMQKENVSDTLLPRVLRLVFTDRSGEKISNENIIHADLKNRSPEDRRFREKFTFRNRTYERGESYFLVVTDDNTGAELERYEFAVDIVSVE